MRTLLKEELLRLVIFSVVSIFQLLNFWQNLSILAYKAVAYKKIPCTLFDVFVMNKAKNADPNCSFLTAPNPMILRYGLLIKSSEKLRKPIANDFIAWTTGTLST